MLRQKLLSHIAEILPRSESFSVSLLSGIEKVWIIEEGKYQGFSRILLSHSVEKLHLLWESFSVSRISRFEK